MAEPAHKNLKNPPGQHVYGFDRYEYLPKTPLEPTRTAQEAPKGVEQGLSSHYTWEEVLQAQNIAYAQGWADAMYKNNSENA